MDDDRRRAGSLVRTWLTGRGYDVRVVHAIPAGAGSRRYWRVELVGRTVICCRYPAADQYSVDGYPADAAPQAMTAFLLRGQLFARRGLRVPEVYEFDPRERLIVIEDLGGESLGDVMARRSPQKLVEDALDLCRRVRATPLEEIDFPVPRISGQDRLFDLLDPFFRWYLPPEESSRARSRIISAAGALCANLATQDLALQHRDFHSQNLLVSRDGEIGMIDFQDAAVAPEFTDLATFVVDPALSRSQGAIGELISLAQDRWNDSGRPLEGAAFRERIEAAAVHRLMQLIGVSARLVRRNGKPRFGEVIVNALSIAKGLAPSEGVSAGALDAIMSARPDPDLVR